MIPKLIPASAMNLTLKILLLEDSTEDSFLIANVLKKNFFSLDIYPAKTREEFLLALDTYEPDVIICDHRLPRFSSIEALVCASRHGTSAPFIVVTGAIEDGVALQAMQLGAFDYVLKSNLIRLPQVVKNAIEQTKGKEFKKQASEELARRSKELSKLNNELDTLVYTVSHNLRSPLKSLSGLLNLAMMEKDPATLSEFHQAMQQSIVRLDQMVQGILDLSRSSRQESRIEQINIRSIIEETFEKMAYLPDFKKLSVDITVDGKADFYSDTFRVAAIFQNLISNSIKYKDPLKPFQFIKIIISITDEAAVIDFSDNGIGIHAKALDRIFQMFYRATDQQDGTGLGLSIVKEAVELLEGTVDVESTLGEGTSFHLRIPNRNNIRRESAVSLLIDRD